MRKTTAQLQRSQVSPVTPLSPEDLLTNTLPLFDLKPILTTHSTPRLVILEQKSLAQEKFSKDGVQKEMHIVVKNTPFQISVGLSSNVLGNKVLDFNLLTLEASLLFDCADEKAVPYLKQKPVEYKGHVNDRADTMKMDMKIKVLTSHCENMLFRIKFSCIDPRSGEDYPSLTVVSAPIKVISKPDQLRKRKQPEGEDAVSNSEVCCAEDVDSKQPPAKKPRTSRATAAAANTQIIESLGRIEDEQKEVRKLLELLTGGKEQNTSVMGEVPFFIPPMATTSTMITDCCNSSCNSNPMMTAANNAQLLSELQQQLQNFTPPSSLFLESVPSECNSCTTASKSTEEESLDLEAVYNRLIDTYLKLPLEQRAEKIRRVIRNNSTRRTETFCEMIALFNSEGLQKETGRECFLREGGPSSSTSSSSPTTCCGEGCPYRKELQRIDDLYSSFMVDRCDRKSGGD